MKPYYEHAGITMHHGDAADVLQTLPDELVHCCVTSPPYFGLRDYGIEQQIGLEQTPAEYVSRLVDVFREVRRVLRADGTLWLNLGDSYNSGGEIGRHEARENPTGIGTTTKFIGTQRQYAKRDTGLKPKDLIGIPWRVAFALQADGWYLRSDIIWAKPNPMPESVTDRPTKAHEYLFLLAKSEKYFYNADAVKEPAGRTKADRNPAHLQYGSGNKQRKLADGTDCRLNTHLGRGIPWEDSGTGRNRRSVWTISTMPYAEAHFATFPEDLVKPCILAGCPVGGKVLDPFAGAGTALLVARDLGNRAEGIELNAEYLALAAKRLRQDAFEFKAATA